MAIARDLVSGRWRGARCKRRGRAHLLLMVSSIEPGRRCMAGALGNRKPFPSAGAPPLSTCAPRAEPLMHLAALGRPCAATRSGGGPPSGRRGWARRRNRGRAATWREARL